MSVQKSKLYLVFFYFGHDSKNPMLTTLFRTRSEIEKMKYFYFTSYRFCLCLIPELDKAYIKDPDVFTDNLTHNFKGVKHLVFDYPFLKEVLKYAKKTN